MPAAAHKFIKTGKVVILTQGRHAGQKAIVVKNFDEGSKERQFGHALVAGLERPPQKVTRAMSKKKILKRSRVKPFIKYVNYQHLMPTRYQVADIELKSAVNPQAMENSTKRVECKKAVKKLFEQRYLERGKNTTGVQYLYLKLRF